MPIKKNVALSSGTFNFGEKLKLNYVVPDGSREKVVVKIFSVGNKWGKPT